MPTSASARTKALPKQPFNTDIVFIQGLQVEAIIGVYEWEQAITQPLIFDIEMTASQQSAAQTDSIHHAINYKTVCEKVANCCLIEKVALLETLAERVAETILAEFKVDKIQICVHKPTAIKNATSVGVKIVRIAMPDPVSASH